MRLMRKRIKRIANRTLQAFLCAWVRGHSTLCSGGDRQDISDPGLCITIHKTCATAVDMNKEFQITASRIHQVVD